LFDSLIISIININSGWSSEYNPHMITKGGSDNVANYRPISVTNCFIKILEKIIFKHLHNYLLRYNILSDDQSGFRHRDSTINQLLVIYDVIMKNLDIGKDVRFILENWGVPIECETK
jgi:hypothetical protein